VMTANKVCINNTSKVEAHHSLPSPEELFQDFSFSSIQWANIIAQFTDDLC